MAKTLQEAGQALVSDLRDTVDAFADADRRNFIDLPTLIQIAEAGIGLFATGMVTAAGQAVGKEVASDIIDVIKRVMHGSKPDPAAAAAAIDDAKAIPAAQRGTLATEVEGKVRGQLATVLSNGEAASLSAKLREQALLVIGDA